MAKSSPEKQFSSWLLDKLKQLQIDESVFLNYIISILDGDEPESERLDILRSILIGCCPTETIANNECDEIFNRWKQAQDQKVVVPKVEKPKEDIDQKLARLLEANVYLDQSASAVPCTHTAEELKIREAILSQYGQAENDEDDDDVEEAEDGPSGLQRNTNASAIHQAEREKREMAKLESQKKKEKDKLDREKQKQSIQDKKEARRKRAQKGERRK